MNLKQKIKTNLGTWAYYTCLIVGGLLGLYITFWVMIIDPILGCAMAIDAGTLKMPQIIITVLSCIFSGTFGCIVSSVFAFAGVIAQTIIDSVMKVF